MYVPQKFQVVLEKVSVENGLLQTVRTWLSGFVDRIAINLVVNGVVPENELYVTQF